MKVNSKSYYINLTNKISDLEVRHEQEKTRQHRKMIIAFGRDWSLKTIINLILIFYALISLFPFFWSLFASFKNPHLLSITGLNPFPKSGEWTLENYDNLLNGSAQEYISVWTYNTIVYSFSVAFLNATLNLLAGYALAQIAMKGKKIVVNYFLASILVPSQATFLPTFYIYTKLGIIGDISQNAFLAAIIFSGMANIVLTFMARQFFISQSKEMEEAAVIEGYNKIAIFFQITLRKMLPLFATQFVLVFMGAWNNFLLFTLFSVGDPERMTINAGITIIASTAIDKEIGYGQLIAISNLSFIPMILIYGISLRIQLRGMRGGNK